MNIQIHFQNKLEKAVGEGKLKDFNFLQKSNWTDIFVSLLPIIIIIAVWILFQLLLFILYHFIIIILFILL
jgi:hypothetical protein